MGKKRNELTAARLRSLFSYDEKTGQFRRKVKTCNSVDIGDISGYDDGRGYIQIHVDGVQYRAHRLAWLYVYGAWPKKHIDHVNREKSDNRISNLREANWAENGQNVNPRKSNKSGRLGVSWNGQAKKWRVQIVINYKNIHIGYFSEINDADAAYAKAKAEIHKFHPSDGVISQ